MLKIVSAEFIKGAINSKQFPQIGVPEFAFFGRSNAGKSSLINMLTGRKGLAMTSQKPGKTQLINHFIINDAWYLVDLPGYGYARLSKDGREKLKKMIEDYTLERKELICLFVLVDARHDPQKIDLEFIEWLGEEGVPFALVFTKADKLTKGKLAANIEGYKARLRQQWEELPPLFITSSEERLGREELLDYIDGINASL